MEWFFNVWNPPSGCLMGVPAKSCRDAMVNLSLPVQKMVEVPTFKRYPKYQICNMDPNNSGTSTRNWKIEILGSVGPPDGLDQTKN